MSDENAEEPTEPTPFILPMNMEVPETLTEISFLKLINGDSIMGSVVHVDEEHGAFYIVHPVKIIHGRMSTNDETISFGMVPYLEMCPEQVIVMEAHNVLAVAVPSKDAIQMFLGYVSSYRERFRNKPKASIPRGMKPKLVSSNDNPEPVDDSEMKKAYLHMLENFDETEHEIH